MASYDPLADFYNQYWGAEYHSQIMSVLDRLLLSDAPRGARILDIGCGTGRVAAQLLKRGFYVVGIDESEAMLEHARLNAPRAEFFESDATSFSFPECFWSAISTFESLNHVLDPNGLESCFRSALAAIRQHFVFDLNREPVFEKFWNGDSVLEGDPITCHMSSTYDPATKLGRCHLEVAGENFVICQRYYPDGEVLDLLSRVGWRRIETFDSARDLGMTGDVALARTFFRCTK